MTVGRLPNFLGTDWEDAFESIKSTPGAFGNIFVAASRQVRLVDVLAMVAMLAGWTWLIAGVVFSGNDRLGLALLAGLPTLLWIAAGVTGGLFFEIGGIGIRSLRYWESYLLIGLFACFGTISLRLALNPHDRQVYRGSAAKSGK